MASARFDVAGIGNAIVDIISRCDDAFLQAHGLPKGHMRLIEAGEVERLYEGMGTAVEISGGSAANTIAGIASFGGKTAFIGKVADDEFGRIFRHDIRAQGVSFETPEAKGLLSTSRCLILVTPDGERTMNTHLGISPYLDRGEVDPETIENAAVTYLEGYLFDRDEAKKAFHDAAEIAARSARKVALTLSDSFCVERHRNELLAFIRAKVDVLFANESELCALYETTTFDDAVVGVRHDARLAVVTRGPRGSVVLSGDRTVEVQAAPVASVVDTTGAGDLYAAGFLFGYSRGFELKHCGQLASLAASEVISHIGARPEQPLAKLARDAGMLI